MSSEKVPRTIQIDSEEEDDDGETRCVCGSVSDKGLMVQCDKCEIWQHGVCVGFKAEDQVPDQWFCTRCETKLLDSRPDFAFVEDKPLISHLLEDYKALERAAGSQFPHSISFPDSQLGCHLLEKYSLLFARHKLPPACTELAFFKALAALFGRTIEEIKGDFNSIADEVEAASLAMVSPPSTSEDSSEPAGLFDGWKKEVVGLVDRQSFTYTHQ